jgi:transposase
MPKKGTKQQKYSLDFKIQLVEKYLRGEGGGVKRLSKETGLKSDRQLRAWIKKYQAGELTETESDKRGRKVGCRKGRPKTTFFSMTEELEYLKIENEYLKKKLQTQGESETFIANLWSSKNLK